MSLGLVLNHLSASGNHTETIVSGSSTAARGTLYVSGAAAFGIPDNTGGEVSFTWPGTDTTFFVSGAVASDASATSFGTVGDYHIAVFGGGLQTSGSLSVDGSIRGGLEAKNAGGTAATPVSQQVAFWTSNLYLSGTDKLRWDDSDLIVGGNLQIQGAATTVSSSNFVVQDSIIGLGFSGSDSFNNLGERSIIFGKNPSPGGLLPALTWDGTRAYTIGVPATPSSSSIDLTLTSSGLSSGGGIYIPGNYGSTLTPQSKINLTYGDGSFARKLVFPVAHEGVVYYPQISGTMEFQIDDLSKLPALATENIFHHGATKSFWNKNSSVAFHATGTNSFNGDVLGKWRFMKTGDDYSYGDIYGVTRATWSFGTFSEPDSEDGEGGIDFLDPGVTVNQNTTNLTFGSNFSATDVTQFAAGNVVRLTDSGDYAYFRITNTPTTSESDLDVEFLTYFNSGRWQDSFSFSTSGHYPIMYSADSYSSGYVDSLKMSSYETATGGKIHLSSSAGSAPIYLTASGIHPANNNQVVLGHLGYKGWSDLYLGDGAFIDFDNHTSWSSGEARVTHLDTSLIFSASNSTTGFYPVSNTSTFNGSSQTSFPDDSGGAVWDTSTNVSPSTTTITLDSTYNSSTGQFDSSGTVLTAGTAIAFNLSDNTTTYWKVTSNVQSGDTTISVEFLQTGTGASTFTADTPSSSPSAYYWPASGWTEAPGLLAMGSPSKSWSETYVNNVDLNGAITTGSFVLDADGDSAIGSSGDAKIDWFVGNISTSKFYMTGSGLYPTADNSYDLGKAAKRYRNIYTGDVNLQNDRGDWTLIEENDFISFRNNMTGRRYRMVMEDITGMGNYGPGNDGEM